MTRAAKVRKSEVERVIHARQVCEFADRYESEIKATIEKAAGDGESDITVTFSSLELARVAASELREKGFITKEMHDGDCGPCCYCVSHAIEVSW